MKIAVVGCGAVGSYYGAMLARDNHDVHFLLRSDYEVVRRRGVQVLSPKGDFTVRPRCAKAPEEIGPSELILIGLKTTANAQFENLLPALVDSGSALVTLQNGLGNEEQLARVFPPSQILGGLCFVCLNRLAPGTIQHLDYGLVVLGEFQDWPQPRTHNLAEAFRHAGIPCKVTDNLVRAHWEKLVWNVPFNGLGVASVAGFEAVASGKIPNNFRLGDCLTTDRLLADLRWERLVRELMLEIIATARGLNMPIEPALADTQIERTRTMGAYRASTLIDFERHQPLELESLFLEPLRQAQRARVSVPRLSALCDVLQQLENRRR
jgi:2-dehydropantoate 2-reductase